MTPEFLKLHHDKLQAELKPNEMAIREGIVINVPEGEKPDRYPIFGYEFFTYRSPECCAELNSFIRHAKGKKIFLDCGAFHGIFSLVFSKLNPDGEAFAFEPFEEPYKMLNEVVELQENKNIYTAQVALSDTAGKMPMREYDGHLEFHPKGEYFIHCIRGDDFLDRDTLPDIIKCDTEGMEVKVLKGLARIISSGKPVIFLEIHYEKLSEQEVHELTALIEKYGYDIYDTETENLLSPVHLLKGSGEKRVILK